jgi:hypothetical protein
MYVRDETRNLWRTLEGLGTGGTRGVWVSGPPGVGKSTEVYAWGMHHATRVGSERRNMLWVHQSSESCYEFVRIVDGLMSRASIDLCNVDKILEECGGCEILIFDAVKQHMYDEFGVESHQTI